MVQQWVTGIFIHWENGFVVFTQTFATCYFMKSLSTEGWILLESILRVKYFMHMYKQLLPDVFLTLKQFHFSFDEHFNSGRNTKVISKISFSCFWKKKKSGVIPTVEAGLGRNWLSTQNLSKPSIFTKKAIFLGTFSFSYFPCLR